MRWVESGLNGWNAFWWQATKSEFDLFEEDRTGSRWINIDNGDEIILLSDGGWRMSMNGKPYRSRYRLFRRTAATKEVTEITDLLWPVGADFDSAAEGTNRYAGVLKHCTEFINRLLSASQLKDCRKA